MTTAIIGVGNIGSGVARRLVAGGESVVLAAKDEPNAEALARELGPLARAASVEDAIADGDAVVFALWLDTIKELIPQHARLLEGKVVIDPTKPSRFRRARSADPDTPRRTVSRLRGRRPATSGCALREGVRHARRGRARRRRAPRTAAGGALLRDRR